MRTALRRLIVIALLTAALIGIGSSANAGNLCLRVYVPFTSISTGTRCLPTPGHL